MRAREGDLIRTGDNVIFDVKGLVHPPDKVIAFPRYIPSPDGTRGSPGEMYRKVYNLGDPVNPVESIDTSGPSGSGTRNIAKGPATFYLKILAASIDYVIIIEVPS